ncbi:MAG TPA: Uma2 family endonuclease [Rhodothermales bacterium]|nr:Uma2 family endonuclease [Rhodothermales bacterium]
MATQPEPYITPEDYLATEREATFKSEYFAGEIFAMQRVGERHILLTGNVASEIHTQLKDRPAKVYASAMRVRVSPTGLYTYPDVVAVCEDAQFDDEHLDTLLNPTVLFEVLSPSTEGYDRGKKFEHYRKVASLQEYVVIAQDRHYVEHYTRQPDYQWLLAETENTQDHITLPSIDCTLAMADIYDKVDLDLNEPNTP